MSRIPTTLPHDLTCLVRASHLSCSQVIWRWQPIAAALHAQIKTWLGVIHKNGCLSSCLSCCVWGVRPSPSWNLRLEQDTKLAPRSDRHRQAPHHGRGHFPPPPQTAASLLLGPRIVETPAIGGAIGLLSSEELQAASGGCSRCQARAVCWGEEQTSQA